jgi:DNA-binding NarL/FixJ family response regulator
MPRSATVAVRSTAEACIQKTGARNRAEALRIASEHGWL